MTTLSTTNDRLGGVGHKHEAIMLFLLAHPEMKLGDVARHFDVQQAWLSTIIHSHAFQDRFADLREQYYGDVTATLADRLTALAHVATEKLADVLESTEDPTLIFKTADMLYGKLGFGGKTAVTVNTTGGDVNLNTITPEALARAEESRRRLRELKALERNVIEGSADAST